MSKKWLSFLVLVLLGGWLLGGYFATNPVVGSHPELRKLIGTPVDFGLTAERVAFPSEDGLELAAWWLPAQGTPRATVILAHGRDANRSQMLRRASFLVRHGYNALAVDLRGHGESQGNYMTPGYQEALDVLGAGRYVRQRGERGPVVLLGHSYGGVAVLLAAARSSEPAAVIADSAFISPADMMQRVERVLAQDPTTSRWLRLGVRLANMPFFNAAVKPVFYLRTGVWLRPEQADLRPAIPRIRCPILFIVGERDAIAPPEDAQRMYEIAASAQKRLVVLPGASHSTYLRAPQAYESAVLDFVQSVLPAQ